MSRTKIDLGILGPGFFYLPEHIVLYCPECGERIADKGKTSCSIFGSDNPGGFTLIIKSCKCGAKSVKPIGIKPIIKPKE